MDKTQSWGLGKLFRGCKTLINSEKPSMRWKSGRTARAETRRI